MGPVGGVEGLNPRTGPRVEPGGRARGPGRPGEPRCGPAGSRRGRTVGADELPPLEDPNGRLVAFERGPRDRVTVILELRWLHGAGHSRQVKFSLRTGGWPAPGSLGMVWGTLSVVAPLRGAGLRTAR